MTDAPAPRSIDAAIQSHLAGRFAEAAAIYRQLIASNPRDHDALHLLGVTQIQLGNPQEAVDLISTSLAHAPDNYNALNHLGEAYRALGSLDEAMTCFERTLELKADCFQAYTNMGNVYQARDDYGRAISCYEKALEINPEYAEAYANLGSAHLDQGRPDLAIACYRRALELRPEFPVALYNLGNAYKRLRNFDEAIPLYQRSIALQPNFVDGYVALARAFSEYGQREDALATFTRALELQPENVDARWGFVFSQLGLVHNDQASVLSQREAFARELAILDQWFTDGRARSGYEGIGSQQPFYLAYHEDDNRDILARYGALCNRLAGHWQSQSGLELPLPRRKSPIRVGIVSAHICDHSVWQAITKGWCQQLNSDLVELHVFSLGNRHDSQTDIARDHAKRLDEGGRSTLAWAREIHARGCDIIIYPEIGMDPVAAKLASLRLAPIQMTTWGQPDTSGMPTIDYYISADDFEPDAAQSNYSERLICLPHLGTWYEPLQVLNEDLALDSIGIDQSKILFICPGTPFKYAPRHDQVWIDIAKRLPECRFLFFKYPVEGLYRRMVRRMERSFESEGLKYQDFVVEIPWLTKPAFYSLMRQADVYLDTIGFSGFNSAMQAIECGLPIVSKDGRFLRGRLASGILRQLDMRETIVQTEREYVDLAVNLGRDRDRRERLREKIERTRHVLFQDPSPIRGLEELLVRVATE